MHTYRHSIRLAFLVAWMAVAFSVAAQQAAAPAPQEPPAEKRFKNIKVLTGMPASQAMSLMHFMRASLGVRCAFCHVVDPVLGETYDRDDKPQKQTARRMIQMVLEINKNNFDGRTQVTCNTCHRGSSRPVSLVPFGQGVYPDTTGKFTPPVVEKLPSPSEILQRYVQALGGEAKLLAVKNRSMRGQMLRIRVDHPGTPKATAVNRGTSTPIEVDFESGKFFVHFQPQAGDMRLISDGVSAWAITPQGQRAMTPAEVERVREVYDPQAPLHLREQAATMTTEGKQLVGQREAYLLSSRLPDGRLRHCFFAVDNGLLLRCTLYRQLWLGLDPEHFDYEDYREVGGVLVPLTINASYLDDNHVGNTRRFTEIKDNIRIDASRFRAPTP